MRKRRMVEGARDGEEGEEAEEKQEEEDKRKCNFKEEEDEK